MHLSASRPINGAPLPRLNGDLIARSWRGRGRSGGRGDGRGGRGGIWERRWRLIKEAIRPASRQHRGDAGSFVIYSGERVAKAGEGEVCERSEEAWGEIVLVNLVKA